MSKTATGHKLDDTVQKSVAFSLSLRIAANRVRTAVHCVWQNIPDILCSRKHAMQKATDVQLVCQGVFP